MHFEQEEMDFAEEILTQLENDYGSPIERIAKFKNKGDHFLMIIIFQDYRICEARVEIIKKYGMPAIQIQGTYF